MPRSLLTWNQDQWCQGELANCPVLCGGQAHNKVNSCVGVSPPRILRAVTSPPPTPSQTIPFSHSQSLDQTQHLLATIANRNPFQSSLTYTCTCSNGTGPANIADYQDTLPNHICQETFAQCRIANPGSQACKTCGTLKPSDVQALPASTSSAAATSSTASSTTAPSPTASSKSTSGAGRIEAVGGMIGGAIGLAAVML